MRFLHRTSALLFPVSLLATAVQAADPPPNGWSGDASAGYIRTAGDTSTTTGNIKAELDYTNAPWRNELKGSAANGHTGDVTTAEQYDLSDKLKYNFDENDYLFGLASFQDDRFSGIAKNYTEAVGYGRRLLNTQQQMLEAEIGGGVSEQQSVGQTNYLTQPTLTLGGKYVHTFSPTSQFTQTVQADIGSKNTFVNPVSQLKVTIVGSLYTSISYDLRYNTTVPEGTHHTDSITSISLGYGFGGAKP